jgi:hypothetical protein
MQSLGTKTRAQLCASKWPLSHEPAHILTVRDGITAKPQTVCKWNKRDSVQDHSHAAHRLQTQRAPAQEIVVVHARAGPLLLPLGELLAVTRYARQGRCLHAVSSPYP